MDKLNKLYDIAEYSRQDIQQLIKKLTSFCSTNGLQYAPLKWFEYAYTILYSQHKIGTVLDVGSAESILPYYLSATGYQVTTLDLKDTSFREIIGRKFNVTSITGDLRNYRHELKEKFDLITNLSVIEHIDHDTKAILNIAHYLTPNGVMVISTDFYKHYIEYPDANRIIVTDRPPGSHCDSRVYTPEIFMKQIIEPLEKLGLKRIGETDYKNVDITDPAQCAVRGLYTFGVAVLRKQ